jgi:hypothetical protein
MSDEIDVGKVDDELRLWVAGQAVRHAELRLSSQAIHRAALEARAASLLGWAVTLALAALTLATKPPSPEAGSAAIVVMLCCFIAAACAALVLWPREWGVSGLSPSDLLETERSSELEYQEGIALLYEENIGKNHTSLRLLARWLRASWMCLVIAPLAGGAATYW